MEILALTPKGYCQFTRGLFILWGSAGWEVQVTRRRWGERPPLVFPITLPMLLVSSTFTGWLALALFPDMSRRSPPLHQPSTYPESSCYLKEERTLSGGGEEGRQHEGQRPPSDRLINRAPGCMQLTLGMALVEGGGGGRSMGAVYIAGKDWLGEE